MKVKLSVLCDLSELVTLDAFEVVNQKDAEGAICFELANETDVVIADQELEYSEEADVYEVVDQEGETWLCEFFVTRNLRVADILKRRPELGVGGHLVNNLS